MVCCEKEAEGWANMALKRAPMTEQEELEAVCSEIEALSVTLFQENRRDYERCIVEAAAREILALRKKVTELERESRENDAKWEQAWADDDARRSTR
jgi:hypothetical protein